MPAKRALIGVLAAFMGMSACNLPTRLGQADLPGTITAQAQTLQARSPAAGSPTATLTSVVQASVTADTNCRTGPSQNFDKVLVAAPGQIFTVVGKNTQLNYWIIQTPTGGTCWLWGRYAVITGDPATLPEYPAPPEPATRTPHASNTPAPTPTPTWTLTPSAPRAPSDFAYSRSCSAFLDGSTPKWREDITLTWNDNSDDELGFLVFAGSYPLPAILPPNTESLDLTHTYNQGTGGPLFDNYRLVVHNAAGQTSGGAVDVPRCP